MSAGPPNEPERRRWNDPAWAAAWPRRERLTMTVTDALLGQARLHAGDRVLDIGTGGGVAALAAARIVGDGAVVGVDISRPLVDLARARARAQGANNLSFTVADAQQEPVPGAPFDVAISQFGVMFFDEPATAFANIREQLVGGGRLAFACWRGAELNRWFPAPALAGLAPPPPPPAPGKSATGPFSLSDAQQTAALLEAGGWREVACTPYDVVATVDLD